MVRFRAAWPEESSAVCLRHPTKNGLSLGENVPRVHTGLLLHEHQPHGLACSAAGMWSYILTTLRSPVRATYVGQNVLRAASSLSPQTCSSSIQPVMFSRQSFGR